MKMKFKESNISTKIKHHRWKDVMFIELRFHPPWWSVWALSITTPEEIENGRFTLKTHRMFSVHTTPEEFENTTITGQFGFVF